MQAIAEGFEVLDKSDFDFNYEDVCKSMGERISYPWFG